MMEERKLKKKCDNIRRAIHPDPCRKLRCDHTDKMYEHEPNKLPESKKCKIYEFNIQTACVTEARRPEFVVLDKDTRMCNIN